MTRLGIQGGITSETAPSVIKWLSGAEEGMLAGAVTLRPVKILLDGAIENLLYAEECTLAGVMTSKSVNTVVEGIPVASCTVLDGIERLPIASCTLLDILTGYLLKEKVCWQKFCASFRAFSRVVDVPPFLMPMYVGYSGRAFIAEILVGFF